MLQLLFSCTLSQRMDHCFLFSNNGRGYIKFLLLQQFEFFCNFLCPLIYCCLLRCSQSLLFRCE